jgi:adenylate cyclase
VTRTGAWIGALCAAIVAVVVLFDPTLFGYEWPLHDFFTRAIARRRPADPRIVIVAISRESTSVLGEEYGRPPYPRSVHAAVVRELMRAGAAVVAFDLTFPERDDVHPDADRDFEATLANAPVVLAVDTSERRPSQPPSPVDERMWTIPGTERKTFNVRLPYFKNAAGIGTIRISEPGPGSAYHTYPIADRIVDNRYVPSLAFETARMFTKGERSAIWRHYAFSMNGRQLPVDMNGELAIRWSDFMNKEHVIDFHRVLVAGMAHDDGVQDPQIAQLQAKIAAMVKGRIVLIAYTAQGLLDLRATPLRTNSAGVEIHANAISNVLNNDFNRRVNRLLVIAVMIGFAALVGAAVHGIKAQIPAGIVGVAGVGAWIAAGMAALAGGWIVPAVAGATSTALTYVVITVIKLTLEQRQTAMLRTTFGRYVSPQILTHILAHPEKVQLGGERRDLTILFSDIRGFTTISEASEPEQVVEMLNEYLTRMVEILLEHGGTLDKFIGDAVMGFWNAPAADPDHPRHAVACALDMIEETARIRERWIGEGKAAIRIGIGVNTGDAVVGNIGAEKVFGYTVIGDAVNLSSRLEGKNKDYGTEIIISEFTKERIGDEFELVYLDDVKVKGKEKAVRIYEVKGRAHA